jgi:hypothetical protein
MVTGAADGRNEPDVRYRVLSHRAIWISAVLILLVGVGAAVWLLLAFGGGGHRERNQLEAIKVAGTLVVLGGGAAALLLQARRLRSAEIALMQKDRDQSLQVRIAAATEADAAARRITDLYTKAVELVGSDNASVRLGGLYALERLAQDNENQRQTIVNVLCAYLRMPFEAPQPPSDGGGSGSSSAFRESVQEREVRLTAQRLLLEHLRPDDEENGTRQKYWEGIDLDLTGALLIDFSLRGCKVGTANFRGATLTGAFVDFHSTIFSGKLNSMVQYSLIGPTLLRRSSLISSSFHRCSFQGRVYFEDVEFLEGAVFGRAEFAGVAYFGGARFAGDLALGSAKFHNNAVFAAAVFEGRVLVGRKTEFSRGTPPEIMPSMEDQP